MRLEPETGGPSSCLHTPSTVSSLILSLTRPFLDSFVQQINHNSVSSWTNPVANLPTRLFGRQLCSLCNYLASGERQHMWLGTLASGDHSVFVHTYTSFFGLGFPTLKSVLSCVAQNALWRVNNFECLKQRLRYDKWNSASKVQICQAGGMTQEIPPSRDSLAGRSV